MIRCVDRKGKSKIATDEEIRVDCCERIKLEYIKKRLQGSEIKRKREKQEEYKEKRLERKKNI